MRRILLLAFLTFSWVHSACGQNKISFHSQNYVGLLEGETGSAFQLQTINGIKAGSWTSGIGVGIDYYRFRTVPVFLSISRYMKPAGKSLYFSADGGLNFFWNKDAESTFGNVVTRSYRPSLYWAGGIGYRLALRNKKDAFLLNIGYSFKRFKEELQLLTFCTNPPCNPALETFDYRLKRLSVRLGFEF